MFLTACFPPANHARYDKLAPVAEKTRRGSGGIGSSPNQVGKLERIKGCVMSNGTGMSMPKPETGNRNSKARESRTFSASPKA